MYDHMIHRIQLQDSSAGLSELSVLEVVGFGNSDMRLCRWHKQVLV